MTRYSLGLRCGGLMEDPGWHVESIRDIDAETIREARAKYAVLEGWVGPTGVILDKLWDPEAQSYWGWSVVRVTNQ